VEGLKETLQGGFSMEVQMIRFNVTKTRRIIKSPWIESLWQPIGVETSSEIGRAEDRLLARNPEVNRRGLGEG
jgi:hypothetical protein